MSDPPLCPDLVQQCQGPTKKRHTPKMAKKFVSDTTSADAPWVTTAAMPIAVGSLAAMSHTQASVALSSGSQRGHTTLRHSQFERELISHPDRAWTSWLLNAIDKGVSLGYTGPRGPSKARNLSSACLFT